MNFHLYKAEKLLLQKVFDKNFIIPILGSVTDKNKILYILKHFSVETIFHAAAYKHVPLVEANIIEGFKK